jgi:hypothetical protein
VLVKPRQPLRKMGRCVWRVLMATGLSGLESEESQHCNTETNRGHTTLHIPTPCSSSIGRKLTPSNPMLQGVWVTVSGHKNNRHVTNVEPPRGLACTSTVEINVHNHHIWRLAFRSSIAALSFDARRRAQLSHHAIRNSSSTIKARREGTV